jgi:hypothetical protein
MAYDNYRTQPDAHRASHPPSFDHYEYDSQHRASAHDRTRTSSSVASDGPPQPSQQPLKNAIGNAFEKSDAARVVDPNLIAQITEQVKKSVLEEIKMSVAASAATQAQQPVHVTPQYVPPSLRPHRAQYHRAMSTLLRHQSTLGSQPAHLQARIR